VDLCSELWKNWMVGDSGRDLGAKTMRGLSGDDDGHGFVWTCGRRHARNRLAIGLNLDPLSEVLRQQHRIGLGFLETRQSRIFGRWTLWALK
jgi:hypothetical protein